jgi:hypothetical protein
MLADDQALVRSALQSVLEADGSIEIVAEGGKAAAGRLERSGRCAEGFVVAQVPDVLVDEFARHYPQPDGELGVLVGRPALQQLGEVLAASSAQALQRELAARGERQPRGGRIATRLDRYEPAAGQLVEDRGKIRGRCSDLLRQVRERRARLISYSRE